MSVLDYSLLTFLQKSSQDPYDVRRNQISPPSTGSGVSYSDMSEFDFCDDSIGSGRPIM